MRILIYNWVQFDDEKKRGGGVTVYLADLLKQLCVSTNWECYFLSSGLEYTFDGKLRIEQTSNRLGEKVKSFQIINSPIHAPASVQFSKIEEFYTDTSLRELMDTFIKQNGPFDIIHFHNLEGISLSVLKLKETYPKIKFIYSIHNYFAFCPQVNLWSPKGNCYLVPNFPHCVHCVNGGNAKAEQLIGSIRSCLKIDTSCDGRIIEYLKKMANRLRKLTKRNSRFLEVHSEDCTIYEKYREENIRSINSYTDVVLAVSEKVTTIAKAYGILPSKVITNYIGTKAAAYKLSPRIMVGNTIKIGYLGYAREDKGFDFLIEALEGIPTETAAKIVLLLAAKCETDDNLHRYSARIETLRAKYKEVSFRNGFNKDNQHKLLEQIDLGIVPSLWEDNLPQIAIEYIASGVPILVSDAGGASELCANPEFVYKSTDMHALRERIIFFSERPSRVNRFWDNPPELMTMETHIATLAKIYGVDEECK